MILPGVLAQLSSRIPPAIPLSNLSGILHIIRSGISAGIALANYERIHLGILAGISSRIPAEITSLIPPGIPSALT